MKKNKRQLRANSLAMNVRLQRIESKTDRVLMLLTNIYKGMRSAGDNEKAYSEAVDNLYKATQNLVQSRRNKAE